MEVIGIDIGGTSIKGSVVNQKGEMGKSFCLPIDKKDNQNQTIEKLIVVINNFIQENNLKNIKYIGMGVPGAIDSVNGMVKFSNNLKWYSLPIKKMIEDGTGLKVKIANDADAAAIGEATFGAAKNYNTSITITLGTGVGSGVVIDHKLYLGNGGMGLEMGHISLNIKGRKCNCGRRGCFERYASATALINDCKRAMSKDKKTLMHKFAKSEGKVNGKVPFLAMEAGDKLAKKVVDQYIEYLSQGLLSICNAYRPEVILLSGGIANSGEYLFKELNRKFKEYKYGFDGYPSVKVLKAGLGYNCGMIGAACLVLGE